MQNMHFPNLSLLSFCEEIDHLERRTISPNGRNAESQMPEENGGQCHIALSFGKSEKWCITTQITQIYLCSKTKQACYIIIRQSPCCKSILWKEKVVGDTKARPGSRCLSYSAILDVRPTIFSIT